MRRLAILAAVGAVASALAATPARGALFFLFASPAADAGDVVTVRLGGTPASFTLADRKPPFRKAIRVYLVPADVAGAVGSRFDPRLHFVGRIVPDRDSRGLLRFKVPPLDTGRYALAYWCPGCARFSRGVSFGVQTLPEVSRYRQWMSLRVRLPDGTRSCPVTPGPYDNGFLSMPAARDGVLPVQRDLGQKLPWVPRRGLTGALFVRGERLDAPARTVTAEGRWGYSSNGRGSWASAIGFPSEGCWRITGRVRDVALSFVVRVVASP